MPWSLAELEAEVIRLRQLYSMLNTANDIDNLAILNHARHVTVTTEITNLQERLSDLEDAMLDTQDNIADHEDRITALE